MFYFNTLNLNQVSGGNKVKQGDFGSTFSYNLADEKSRELDVFDKKTAYINLVLNDNIVFTTTAIVDKSTVTFHIDKAIPTGLYFLEIKVDNYIFPSDRQTVILVTAGSVAYDLKDLVPNYDTNMTISSILSDLSQKGIDITNLKSRLDETDAQLAVIKDYVLYEDFGAKGDGMTDDYQAIYNAHVYANEHNLKVRGNSKSTYYIKDIPIEIPIKTETDWSGANFVIDDRGLTDNTVMTHLFKIQPSQKQIDITINSLSKDTKTISALANYGDVLLHVVNDNKKQYIRYGVNANKGFSQQEVIRVINGKVISPIRWDYTTITSAKIYVNDKKKLFVGNGVFKTIINTLPNYYANGVNRGICILRSNTILYRITHLLEGESTPTSRPYNGWISVWFTTDVLLRDLTLSGHKVFYNENGVPMGNYDLAVDFSTNITMDNIKQSNSILDKSLWGIMDTNYIKDVYVFNSQLSRFDTHRCCANIKIDNCILGHQGINLIGGGLAHITNTKVYNTHFIDLREDYGGTWDGLIKIENCELIPNDFSATDIKVVRGGNTETHDFGYKCYFPNLEIDGLIIHTVATSSPTLINNKVLNSSSPSISGLTEDDYDVEVRKGRYPYIFKDYVKAKDVRVTTPCKFSIFYNHPQYCYVDNKHHVKVNSTWEDSSHPDPFIELKPNFKVIVDNCDLWDLEDNSRGDGSLINTRGIDTTHTFNFNNHRMCPDIVINNSTVSLNMGLYPIIVTCNGCKVKKASGGFNKDNGILYLNNCWIGYRTTNIIVRMSHKNVYFDRCHFVSPESSPTRDRLINVYNIFSEVNSIPNTVGTFRIFLHLNNCTYEFGTDNLINGSQETMFSIDSDRVLKGYVNFNLYHARLGSTNSRPNYKVPFGTIYFNTSTNRLNVYSSTGWVEI